MSFSFISSKILSQKKKNVTNICILLLYLVTFSFLRFFKLLICLISRWLFLFRSCIFYMSIECILFCLVWQYNTDHIKLGSVESGGIKVNISFRRCAFD